MNNHGLVEFEEPGSLEILNDRNDRKNPDISKTNKWNEKLFTIFEKPSLQNISVLNLKWIKHCEQELAR